MEWLKNLNDAIKYIESNLTEEISYDKAAMIAGCSTSYFQRLFTYISGISLSEYIRRRKMTQAAFDLQTSQMKVIDVALKYGYDSPTAFNRAFKSVHGITPVAARKNNTKLSSYLPIMLSVNVSGGKNMPYQIEEKDGIRAIGYRIPITVNIEENQKIIPKFWKETLEHGKIEELLAIKDETVEGILGVTDYTDAQGFYYYIAVTSNKRPINGMHEIEIPAHKWAVFSSDGPYKENIQNIYHRFLTEWLPFSGYRYAEVADVEVYKEGASSGYSEFWLGISD